MVKSQMQAGLLLTGPELMHVRRKCSLMLNALTSQLPWFVSAVPLQGIGVY